MGRTGCHHPDSLPTLDEYLRDLEELKKQHAPGFCYE